MSIDIDHIHQAAIEVARRGGDHTLRYFNKNADLKLERKEDQSPVTAADREAEEIMREEISSRFPDHGILGEEYGRHQPDAQVRWILDPIDGTKSFIHGVPLYTTLVGVLVNDQPICGVIYAPALKEMCEAAKGKGTRLNGESCKVRNCNSLGEATFLSTDMTTAAEYGYEKAFRRLLEGTRLNRTWGDAYGHMLVATGRADVMFDPVLNIWDAAPLMTVLQEAGGVFADTKGKETIHSGNGISCSRKLLPQVLQQFHS